MSKALITILGKAIKGATKLRGGGSALPGLIVEKIDPNFIKYTLSQLSGGVVVVSGTNGKTTTTKMIVELLESQGLKVFTNSTGSNFTRGIVASLLSEVDIKGNLHADIAVLELDEAHAVKFIDLIKPKYCLLLNVMRDQLDRFGEIDYTTNLLRKIADSTTDVVVLNREDYRIANISKSIEPKSIKFFGLDEKLLDYFPSDDDLHNKINSTRHKVNADVILSRFDDEKATFEINGKKISTKMKLSGAYNIYNGAGALTLVRAIIGDKVDEASLIKALSQVSPAFGRGEKLSINGTTLEIILVKNPSGFRLALKSFKPTKVKTMIAINDDYADGRDMSWLWDVDFTSLAKTGVRQVSGIRAYDMALRLQYDEVKVNHIDLDIKKATESFIKSCPKTPKRIYASYTAMLAIRRYLSKITKVEAIK